jgi:hypothetical protein
MIDAIENSAYAIWVRESPSIWAFTTILSLHAMGLAIIVGINTMIALRLLGYVPTIPVNSLRKLYPWMYLGFTINAFSGLSLLAANLDNDVHNCDACFNDCWSGAGANEEAASRGKVFEDPLVVNGTGVPAAVVRHRVARAWTLAIRGRLSGSLEAWVGFSFRERVTW